MMQGMRGCAERAPGVRCAGPARPRRNSADAARRSPRQNEWVPRLCRIGRHPEPGFKNGRLPEPSGTSAKEAHTGSHVARQPRS